MYGVPNRGCTLLTPGGSSRSRLIAKKMRGWLMSMTSSTLRDAGDRAGRDEAGRPVLVDHAQRVADRRVQELRVRPVNHGTRKRSATGMPPG